MQVPVGEEFTLLGMCMEIGGLLIGRLATLRLTVLSVRRGHLSLRLRLLLRLIMVAVVAVVVVVVVVILRRLHLAFHRRQRRHRRHRQPSDAETDGAAQGDAAVAAEPPAELPTKAPVVQDIRIGAATAQPSHGMQRLTLALVAAAVRRIQTARKVTAPAAAAVTHGTINRARSTRTKPKPRGGSSTAGSPHLIIMNRFLISFLIGALLALTIAALLLPQKDDGTTIIAEWEKLARDYQEGKLTLAEYRRGAEKLIKRSKNIPRKPCNRKWHTKPCGSK